MSKTSKTITVGAARFGAEAAWIAKATPKSGYIPLFKTVQVGVDDGVLTLRRTNLDVFAHTVLPGSGGAAAAILVDAGQLVAALKGASGDAKVDVADDRLRLAIGGRILSLTAANVGDEQFPAWPDFTPAAAVILRAPQLARALTSVGDDPTLPMLTGVKFEDGKMLSTDRFRLTRIRYDDDGFTALIPAGVLRPFASGTELVRVEHGKRNDGNAVEGSMVRLSNWGYTRTITGLVLDADFPKWQQLIPDAEQMPVSVLLPRRQLLDAVGAGDDVTLTVAADGAQVLVVSTDRDGSMEVEQGVKVIRCIRGDGLPFTIRLNAKNLAGCLKGISAGAVVLMASTPSKPVLLQFSDDLHLLMPVRISA
jgi:DNA polymerase III sliding clamp (beta) subunit (PCNA family)